MFKELGAFIDEVGRSTGRVFKEMLSDKDDEVEPMTGIIETDNDSIVINSPNDTDEDKLEGIHIRLDD